MGLKTSRREFLKQMALTGAAISGFPGIVMGAEKMAGNGGKSRVVVATDHAVLLAEDKVVQDVLEKMLDKSIVKLTDSSDAQAGWGKLFSPSDVVVLKVNCIAPGIATRPEVAQAVINGLKLAGVKEENIIIWDRTTPELLKCGFTVNRDSPGVKCYGVDGDWGQEITQGAFKGRIAKIISEKATAIVNLPILKTHGSAGMTCCLKNHYGSFDNPRAHHDNHCNPAIADFSAIPMVKEKTRLVVADAMRLQYDGGPGYKPDAQYNNYSLITSKDPVAADCVGLQAIQKRRAEVGLPPVAEKMTAWLQSAQERGVGVCNPANIEVLKV